MNETSTTPTETATEAERGKLITTYRGYEVRENTFDRIGVDIHDPAGQVFWWQPNVAQAKSVIDREIAAREVQNARTTATPAKPAQLATAITNEDRAARAKRLLNRYENNPNDLV